MKRKILITAEPIWFFFTIQLSLGSLGVNNSPKIIIYLEVLYPCMSCEIQIIWSHIISEMKIRFLQRKKELEKKYVNILIKLTYIIVICFLSLKSFPFCPRNRYVKIMKMFVFLTISLLLYSC